jgi:hypothetical protein
MNNMAVKGKISISEGVMRAITKTTETRPVEVSCKSDFLANCADCKPGEKCGALFHGFILEGNMGENDGLAAMAIVEFATGKVTTVCTEWIRFLDTDQYCYPKCEANI